MAAWFSVVAPLLPELIRAARPMFTRSREPSQIPQQIRELQDAVDHNDQAIKTLAGEMEQTLAALKQASGALERTIDTLRQSQEKLEARAARLQVLAVAAVTTAALAFAVAAYALAR
jgi:ABC-type transporter Mla subunit MlaD